MPTKAKEDPLSHEIGLLLAEHQPSKVSKTEVTEQNSLLCFLVPIITKHMICISEINSSIVLIY